jgi:DNA topoisomerase I
VLSGRYGPYVKHGDTNATLPRGKDPAKLTMEEAVQLIAERIAKGPSKPKGRRSAKPKGGDVKAEKPKAAKAKAAPAKARPKSKAKSGTREAAE